MHKSKGKFSGILHKGFKPDKRRCTRRRPRATMRSTLDRQSRLSIAQLPPPRDARVVILARQPPSFPRPAPLAMPTPRALRRHPTGAHQLRLPQRHRSPWQPAVRSHPRGARPPRPLSTFDVSHNRLSGPIPVLLANRTGAGTAAVGTARFNASSFVGNKGPGDRDRRPPRPTPLAMPPSGLGLLPLTPIHTASPLPSFVGIEINDERRWRSASTPTPRVVPLGPRPSPPYPCPHNVARSPSPASTMNDGGVTPRSSSSSTFPPMQVPVGGRSRYGLTLQLRSVWGPGFLVSLGGAHRCVHLCLQLGGVRRGDGEIFGSVEPATPARLCGRDAAAGDSLGQRQQPSPGLLDLHAFDTDDLIRPHRNMM
ncbi:proline-rich receptor-like protein kinase PERK8 [Zea mays]|uniref:Uncharacterized protein n=1 Tax=Zea mays TaxID=4577 RepID=K7U9L3_MAIZE|nr:proline-rich receptor-like protein kinase PERK8 [Zea mays]AQK59100.1 hypothetical protein ZEAMMB73_Zm00001d053255 [Zea mays]